MPIKLLKTLDDPVPVGILSRFTEGTLNYLNSEYLLVDIFSDCFWPSNCLFPNWRAGEDDVDSEGIQKVVVSSVRWFYW